MIIAIILILALVLAFLFVDWSRVMRRFRKDEHLFDEMVTQQEAQPIPAEIPVEAQSTYMPVEEPAQPVYRPSQEVEKLLEEADVHFRKAEMKAAEKIYLGRCRSGVSSGLKNRPQQRLYPE
jgi:hypothetical protein